MVQNVHTVEFGSGGTGDEEERTVCGSPERVVTLALWVLSAERLYLAMR